MNKPEVVALIVLYETKILESQTFQTIIVQDQSLFNLKLIIWDNSPVPVPNDELVQAKALYPFEYISTPINTWLSKVYNQIISSRIFDYIILLDQDSTMPNDFFSQLALGVKNYPCINLFLPLVINQGKLVSPGSFIFFKGRHWKRARTGLISSKNTLAITSGMTISSKYLLKNNIKFDERLNLYAIDTSFMLEYTKKEKWLFVLPVTFAHNTVLWSNPPAGIMLDRFDNLTQSWIIMLHNRPVALTIMRLYTILSLVRLSINYRDLRFLKIINKYL
jgi:GT2 family glycosyltransferase